jgi:peptide/nickel transport system substrate-binding protein
VAKIVRLIVAVAAVAALAILVAACGSSNKSSSSSTSTSKSTTAASTGPAKTVTVLYGTAPDYLDPGEGYTTQSAEATWVSYTPLYTYAHKSGAPGGAVIPGLATGPPKISDDGKTYEMTLRKGLTYSDGTPVKASDLRFSIQRAIKLPWGGKSFYTQYIKGADAFDTGKATTISGIQADDATGKITISLVKPYGAFLNVLAFPSSSLLPKSTPIKNMSNHPPPGVGPYILKNVVPNHGFTAVINPKFASFKIPGIPVAKNNVKVIVASNTNTEGEQVLNNTADVFDWADQLSPSLEQQAEKQTSRFKKIATASTYYFFLNTKTKPFNNQKAREAVNWAVDRRALSRLNSGNFTPTCYFLPPGIVGHPTGPCPYGDPNQPPNLAKAKQVLAASGMKGAKVTVWGQQRDPRVSFINYYTDVLNKIGFKAKAKFIADAQYFPTIGNLKLNPQTGFADWNQDFPNPSDFYLLMDAKSIQPTNNQNFSQVDDPKVQSALAKLNPVPASQLDSVAKDWTDLDTYLAKKAYIVSFGNQEVPQFMSDKMNFSTVAFNPVYGNDWSTFDKK